MAESTKTPPTEEHTSTCGTRVCNSSLNLNLKASNNVHSSHLIGDPQETDICRVGLTQKLGSPLELSSGQQQYKTPTGSQAGLEGSCNRDRGPVLHRMEASGPHLSAGL
ncbi:hypothetical protein fugu_006061 [Takifugu bimaculatus]|uniref:Uncharacterized protein n=1 Tax=Takifugu bimaculatus TaxID=433685 RepID=A0A4Z2B9Y5_9TELE|nr:hypothetical protein fugu_006061 [Takifugu bimaculatus]